MAWIPFLEQVRGWVLSCQAKPPPPPHAANTPNAFLERLRELGFGFRLSPISEDKIRPIAQRISKQRPWRSDQENWVDAEKALDHAPLGPWIIRFSGEKERSGWDWGELSLKVSVPVMILLAGFLLNYWADERQEKLAREQREAAVVKEFIKEMQTLIIQKQLVPGKEGTGKNNTEALVLPRELTLAALSQLKSDEAYEERNQIFRFIRGLGLANNIYQQAYGEGQTEEKEGLLLVGADMGGLNFTGSNLSSINFTGANLKDANLKDAHMPSANFTEAYLRDADFTGAGPLQTNFTGADLTNANFTDAYMFGADFTEAILRDAAFTDADLFGANFTEAILGDADFTGADLMGADFTGACGTLESLRSARNIPEELKKLKECPY